mmetsp:Transcript_16414/g.27096  ORF Transcript_16414/g.27096 Transcript_16414/m.27096 type:complete len:428 (+) Transcript_16414:150-1433(+)|eukprot:CAMPEP_0184655726 /NCGR_PEP_ID=MMETSP0308-20130426/14373_1 /TAXON_ID=38269 /ORGANISM="Gloeochaete witrockiana, Strain SAG 46.84" /LENGTH=427 /DNA_ID=CAMNT_0027092437 /DNA_START=105 /DNA_END=1388 /DNA_ORIENTATION=+
MDANKLNELKKFLKYVQADPKVLHFPEMKFFRDFIEQFGGVIPEPEVEEVDEEEEEVDTMEEEKIEVEEEPEEIDPDVIPEETDDSLQEMGDEKIEVTEEMQDQSVEAKMAAVAAMEEGNFAKAVELFTQAVKLNPGNSLMHANRANAYLKLKMPRHAIRDCDVGLRINPDSGKAYKIRGKAYALIGSWELAAKDLRQGEKIDHDDDTYGMLKRVEDKLHKHKEREDRINKKREAAEAAHAARKAKAEAKSAPKEEPQAKAGAGGFPGFGGMPFGAGGMPFGGAGGNPFGAGGMFGGAGGGMPFGAGGMPGGFNMPGMPAGMPGMPAGMTPDFLQGILQDPELITAMSNPKVAAALQEVASDPSKMAKYANDPEIAMLMGKVMKKMGKSAGPGAGPTAGPAREESTSHTKPAPSWTPPKTSGINDLD